MGLSSKEALKDCLNAELEQYFHEEKKLFVRFLMNDHDYQIWQYQKALRTFEYHLNRGHRILSRFWNRRCNTLGGRLGIYIRPNCFDPGLRIWHYGSIMVNSNAKIGKNCQLHGCNCIGNKGVASHEAPVLGNNVDLGVGAVVVGNVYIADGVRIGANAVVTKSCYEKDAIMVGNPAKVIKPRGNVSEIKEDKNEY